MGVGRRRCGVSRKSKEQKRCEGCHYYRGLAAGAGAMACHYCIDHHELRKRDGEKCLSFKAKDRSLVGEEAAR